MLDPPPVFDLPAPVREGATADFAFHGESGESIWLLSKSAQQPLYAPLAKGLLLPGPAPAAMFIGSAGPTGTVRLSVPVRNLPSVQGQVFYGQALFLNHASGFVLSNPASSVALDASY